MQSQSDTEKLMDRYFVYFITVRDILLFFGIVVMCGTIFLSLNLSSKYIYTRMVPMDVYVRCRNPDLNYPPMPETLFNQIMIYASPTLAVLTIAYVESMKSERRPGSRIIFWSLSYLYCQICCNFTVICVNHYTYLPSREFLQLCKPKNEANCTLGRFYTDVECTVDKIPYSSLHTFPSAKSAHYGCLAAFMLIYVKSRVASFHSVFGFMIALFVTISLCLYESYDKLSSIRAILEKQGVSYLLGYFFAVFTVEMLRKSVVEEGRFYYRR